VLSAPSSRLTSTLVQKMNVLRGLDVTFYLGHHRGGHLGNYAENDANSGDGGTVKGQPRPTIDQLMAWSDSFYPDLATIKERSLVIGGWGMSAMWSSPLTHDGAVQSITPERDSLALFDRIFVPPADPAEKRPPIVDRVLEDYKRLRTSNARLSRDDRQRLDDHIERLDELERKLKVVVACGEVTPPTQGSLQAEQAPSPMGDIAFWKLHNDVVAVAFGCDTCRVVSMRADHTFSEYGGDWHHDVAHQAERPDGARQAVIEAAHQVFFQEVFVDLLEKLDAIQDPEGTVLDNSLVQWTHESGCMTHDPIELPVITAGSAGGFLRTGQYVDYRNLQKKAHTASATSAVSSNVGLIYNQWLGTALQAMGLPRSEYEEGQHGGYGVLHMSTETWFSGYQKYPASVVNAMGEVLPYLKA
jgi:hypothetical protein